MVKRAVRLAVRSPSYSTFYVSPPQRHSCILYVYSSYGKRSPLFLILLSFKNHISLPLSTKLADTFLVLSSPEDQCFICSVAYQISEKNKQILSINQTFKLVSGKVILT